MPIRGAFTARHLAQQPEGYEEAKEAEQQELESRTCAALVRGHHAREGSCLVLPRVSVQPKDKTWIKVLDLGLPHLPDLDVAELSHGIAPSAR